MKITIRRYSILWWSTLLFTAAVIAGVAFLLLKFIFSVDDVRVLWALIVVVAILEWWTAYSMQGSAPSRIDIGPGEKGLATDTPAESAVVISGFDGTERGQVSIRGETWQAIHAPGESGPLPKGTEVRVIEREGLTLVVSTKPG